jgi:hypothetical protein
MRAGPLLFLLAACFAAPVGAVSQATVAVVQMPGWLTRGEQTMPLAPGMEVRNGDVLKTGEGARAYLKLADGSTVKLGESARMTFYARSLSPARLFRGALDVATGAFRFTSDLLRRVQGRDVTIRVGTATIGVRGTDVWGRSDEKDDIVCLIEGKVEVSHAGATVALDQPLSFFVAPQGQPAKPVAAVDPAQLAIWARQTDIQPGGGAALADGRWSLLLGSFANQAEALAVYDRARQAGYPARIKPTQGETGGWNYDVRLPGFPSSDEATAAARWLKAGTGIDGTPIAIR